MKKLKIIVNERKVFACVDFFGIKDEKDRIYNRWLCRMKKKLLGHPVQANHVDSMII